MITFSSIMRRSGIKKKEVDWRRREEEGGGGGGGRLKFIWLLNVTFESEMAKKLTVETGQIPIQGKKEPFAE